MHVLVPAKGKRAAQLVALLIGFADWAMRKPQIEMPFQFERRSRGKVVKFLLLDRKNKMTL